MHDDLGTANPTQASVLIIDDHQSTLDSYSTLLRLAGFETATADTGRSGIALALARRFDVLMIDLRLPDLSGVDIVRQLKGSNVTARMVIVTAFPELESSFDAAAAGADGYVEGPLFGDDVPDVVAQALDGPLPVRHPDRGPVAIDTVAGSRRGLLDSRVQEVKRIIDEHLDAPFSISELAARVEWSESRLSHRFHASLGVSIIKYRAERRLQEASRNLVTTHRPIRQIAYGVGYRSLSLADFRHDFRERFGMSPRAYRARFWRGPTPSR
jgi:AraC-like DNA-binding protein/ActR/RegA family two-component response regulator